MADPKTPRSRNPSRGQRGAQKTEPPRASEGEGGSARDGDERGDGRGLLTGNDFPILTEEVDLDQLTKPTLPRGGTSSTGEIVERALRDVLGWRPRAGDARGFLAALDQSFTCEEVQGHTECRWTPRSYAVEIQADMGAVTGAQASIYARAKATLDQVLPLLDGLQPLIPDYDRENVAAIRAIVRTQLTDLVAELGVEGGPRVARVDQLFSFLVGVQFADRAREQRVNPADSAEDVGGNLGFLRDRFGLRRGRINTIEEEQNYTNFLIIVDHVLMLALSWFFQRLFFNRIPEAGEPEPYLGTQLLLLSRDLAVISESIHEVEYAMDSVFLGPAERQTLELQFGADPPMFVSELLAWVEQFASQEGPRLIEEGGKQGLANFFQTVTLLQSLVQQAGDQPTLPDAYQKRRVARAFEELARQLENAANRVEDIEPPDLESPQARRTGAEGGRGRHSSRHRGG